MTLLSPVLDAAAPLLKPLFSLWGSPVTLLEVIAFGLSLWMVRCNMRVQALAWPLAILSSLLYALLFAASQLYGEAGLQFVFVAFSLWGWWQWLRGQDAGGQPLTVAALSRTEALWVSALTLAAWPALALLLQRATDSTTPWLDGLTTTASLAGQYLLGRKRVENWAVWLGVNVVSVGLFAVKGLWLTLVLYAIFALLSVAGWRAWRALLAPRVDAAPGGPATPAAA